MDFLKKFISVIGIFLQHKNPTSILDNFAIQVQGRLNFFSLIILL